MINNKIKNNNNNVIKNNNKIKINNLLYYFIIAAFLLFYYKIRKFLLKSILLSIEYFVYQPIGIKHNKILRTVFGKSYKSILDQNYCFDLISALRFCSKVVFFIYRNVFKTLREMLELLNNTTYNDKMKRYDTIYLQTDQIILTVILTSILLVIYSNLILIYSFFVLIYLIIEILQILLYFLQDLIQNNSLEIAIMRIRTSIFYRSKFKRSIFTGELDIIICN